MPRYRLNIKMLFLYYKLLYGTLNHFYRNGNNLWKERAICANWWQRREAPFSWSLWYLYLHQLKIFTGQPNIFKYRLCYQSYDIKNLFVCYLNHFIDLQYQIFGFRRELKLLEYILFRWHHLTCTRRPIRRLIYLLKSTYMLLPEALMSFFSLQKGEDLPTRLIFTNKPKLFSILPV